MRDRTVAAVVSGVLVGLLAACNSFDAPGVDGDSKVVIPTDARATVESLRTLPAISGGTLTLTDDGSIAVAADPDRDRVSIVPLAGGAADVVQIALEPGDEPGRVAIDSGKAYVALRGAGDLLQIDIQQRSVLSRTHICAAPRGVAVEAGTGLVHVACAEGRLVSLSVTDASVVRDLHVDGDLRDVLVTSTGLRLTTFKSSQLITLSSNGSEALRTGPGSFSLQVQREDDEDKPENEAVADLSPLVTLTRSRPMENHLAWRALQVDGEVMMLHQASAAEEVDIKKTAKVKNGEVASPYGGGGALGPSCQGVVVPMVTTVSDQGPMNSIGIADGVVAVDMAASSTVGQIAIVEAGTADKDAPVPQVVSDRRSGVATSNVGRFAGSTSVASLGALNATYPFESRVMRLPIHTAATLNNSDGFGGCQQPETFDVPGQATAVAYTKSGTLVVQSREPALVTLIPADGTEPRVVELGGDSVRDTGHELFHRDSGGGIACASCHAEGAEDGHVWNFKGQGVRRTQALHVGLKGTAPFHWAGDETDLSKLMEDVFVGRMGGVHQSQQRVGALTKFLFALEPPRAGRDLGDPAAMRGKELFESAAAGCSSCHTGSKFTDNKSYDVGTSHGELLQVPSLRAVSYRAPFIHTGCAHTLRDRFDPTCGGAKHGNVAALNPSQIDDVIAYLETL